MKKLIIVFSVLCCSTYAFAGTFQVSNNSDATIGVWKYGSGVTFVSGRSSGSIGGIKQKDRITICWTEKLGTGLRCIQSGSTCCNAAADDGAISVSGTFPQPFSVSGNVTGCTTSVCS